MNDLSKDRETFDNISVKVKYSRFLMSKFSSFPSDPLCLVPDLLEVRRSTRKGHINTPTTVKKVVVTHCCMYPSRLVPSCGFGTTRLKKIFMKHEIADIIYIVDVGVIETNVTTHQK